MNRRERGDFRCAGRDFCRIGFKWDGKAGVIGVSRLAGDVPRHSEA